MLVLDDMYVSDEVLDFLEESGEQVLDNASARRLAKGRKLNLATRPTGRICALSEANLEAIKTICDDDMRSGIRLLKDKAACRRALAPLYPDYTFEEHTLEEMLGMNPSNLRLPLVVKPSVGFFSLGIYPVFSEDDWRAALSDIAISSASWKEAYGNAVVDDSKFLMESYIEGTEYALDAFMDASGKAVILDILEHDFAPDDVSDRLYYTSKAVMEENLDRMTDFLDRANGILHLHDFPMHVEVRVRDGQVIPIEFNPLRFAGLCNTDVSYFAYGFKTYEYFLKDQHPKWDSLLAGKDGLIYTMIVLNADGLDVDENREFDYAALCSHFRKTLAIRPTDQTTVGMLGFGFLFTETREEDRQRELGWILSSDLAEFIS